MMYRIEERLFNTHLHDAKLVVMVGHHTRVYQHIAPAHETLIKATVESDGSK
ncbi:MAG: hypothetical protein AAF558_01860 [Verrucomicrobiota bacterium]